VCSEELPAAVAAPQNEEKCPACGALNPAGNLACEACGAEMHAAAATAPANPPAPAAPDAAAPATATPAPAATTSVPLHPGQTKLVVEQGQSVGAQFILNDAEILVGREDEDEEIFPDIDLSDQDAGYVHRRHATLRFENDQLTVTHLGGSNKTRINNKPIPDNVPQPVQPGDKIAFGKVVLRLMPV
jgi:pSer/pThr/pTyr-binding forkhead associated (FHA) protein